MVLLPSVNLSNLANMLKQVDKAGVEFRLLILSDRAFEERKGELPARNALFRMALQDPDWQYCVTLSDDIYELPQEWGVRFLGEVSSLPKDVGAINAFGFVNTFFPDGMYAQHLIDADGNNREVLPIKHLESETLDKLDIHPPNPELSTACCLIKREVLETVGMFDTGFGKGGGMEHWDYVIRMYQAGYQNLLTYKVRFKANIATGNNFAPNDTYTYYHKKWGTKFDGISTKEFVERARSGQTK